MHWLSDQNVHIPNHRRVENNATRILRITRIARVLMFTASCAVIWALMIMGLNSDVFKIVFLFWVIHVVLYTMLIGDQANMAMSIVAKIWVAFGEEVEEELGTRAELATLRRSEREAAEREEETRP